MPHVEHEKETLADKDIFLVNFGQQIEVTLYTDIRHLLLRINFRSKESIKTIYDLKMK